MCIYTCMYKSHIYIYLYMYAWIYIYIHTHSYPQAWGALSPAWNRQGNVDAPVLHGPNGAHVHVLVEELTWENHRKTIGKPWENHRKTMGKP